MFGEEWAKMSEEERRVWNDQAANLRAQYNAEMNAFYAKPRKKHKYFESAFATPSANCTPTSFTLSDMLQRGYFIDDSESEDESSGTDVDLGKSLIEEVIEDIPEGEGDEVIIIEETGDEPEQK